MAASRALRLGFGLSLAKNRESQNKLIEMRQIHGNFRICTREPRRFAFTVGLFLRIATLLSCTRSKDDFFVIVDLRSKIVELESARARSWNSVLHAHVHERHADARVAA